MVGDFGGAAGAKRAVFVRGWQTPALLCVEDAGIWRNESAWPPPRMQPTMMYLARGGMLSDAAMPIDQRLDQAYSLPFTTEPLRL